MKVSEAVKALNKVLELKGDVEIGNTAANLIEREAKAKADVVLDFLKYIANILHEKKEILSDKMEKKQIELDFWQKLIDVFEEGMIDKGDDSDAN